MAGSSIAKAYVQIIPSAVGIKGKLSSILGSEATSAGKSAGQSSGNALVKGLKTAMGSASKVVGTAFKAAAAAGLAGFSAATAGVVAFGKSAVSAGSQFDSSMSQVAATMGTTVDQISDLRSFAMEMGATTAFSATEAADALNYMALAGYDSTEAMEALPSVLNLAAAGSIDLASASDMVTDAQSALGLSMDESAQLVDKMAMASSKSNTSVAQLGEAILTVGGTAKNLAGGTTELATALGILADNGVKGAEGGTALRNIILSLSAPTDTAKKAIDSLGLSVFDAQGNMRSLNDIFGDLSGTLGSMTQEKQTQVLNEIFNKVDLKSVNALLANTGDRFNELSGYIDNATDAAKNMANTQLDNLSGDVTLFKSALEGAQIVISDQLTPYLREFVQLGTDGITRVSEAFQQGGLAGAISAAKDVLSDAATEITGSVVPAIVSGIRMFLTEIVGLSDDTVSGIFNTIQSVANGIGTIKDAVGSAIGTLGDTLNGFGVSWGDIWDGIASGISAAAAVISGVITGIADAIAWVVEEARTDGTILNSVWTVISNAVSAAWSVIQTAISAIGNTVSWLATQFTTEGTTINFAWSALKTAISNIGAGISAVIDGIVAVFDFFVSDSEEGSGLFSNAWQLAADLFGSVVLAISETVNGIADVIGWLVDEATTDGTLINAVWTNISTSFTTAVNMISDVFGAFVALFQGDFDGFAQGLVDATDTLLDGIKTSWDTAWNTIKTNLGPILDSLVSDAKSAWDTMKENASSTWESMKSNAASAWDTMKNNASTSWSAIKSNTSAIWSGIKAVISGDTSGISSDTLAKFDRIKTGMSSSLTSAKNSVLNIFSGIKDGIASKIEAARLAVHNAIEAIKEKFNFSWSLPKLKLPHITISGSFSLVPPSAPSFGISWYAKAMNTPMLLRNATIFGAAGGNLLGGGEAGDEVVSGAKTLMGMIRGAVGGELSGSTSALEAKLDRLIALLARMTGVTINVNGTDYRSKMELAEAIMELLERDYARQEAAL